LKENPNLILKKSLFASLLLWVTIASGSNDLTLIYKDASAVKTPMGSLWKLYVHSYLLENGVTPAPYTCRGQSSEEIFCCEKGKSVDLVSALAQSCGPFYQEKLQAIGSAQWKRFWKDQGITYSWLDKRNLVPGKEILVEEILSSLASIAKFKSFTQLKENLFEVVSRGTLEGELGTLGTNLFIKTWTWEKTNDDFIGGFAGWTRDGLPVWAMGKGSSKEVVKSQGEKIFKVLPASVKAEGPVVQVNFFKRYPVKRVISLPDGKVIYSGRLNGDYQIDFDHTSLKIHCDGQLELSADKKITGKFSTDEYVARVLEREGGVNDLQAARAMAVLIRSYLERRGQRTSFGFIIDDTSDFQRVGATSPGAKALAAARFTQGLVLKNTLVSYTDKTWFKMTTLARQGKDFVSILNLVMPKSEIALVTDPRQAHCQRLLMAENYLTQSLKKWKRTLHGHTGFEDVKNVQVCLLSFTRPYSDLKNNRIYLNFDESVEARRTLAHEYLHLGFKFHPLTQNESFIEDLAQRLTGVSHD
jgi:uncharacterized protein YfaQ (DUF2300 family)